MGEQVGGVNSFRQKFIDAKNQLIQQGVKNPKTKDIIAAMRSQQSSSEQSPVTGLQVEQNSNLNQISKRQDEMANLMREKSNFKQFASRFLASGYSSYLSNFQQEVENILANQNLSENDKNARIHELQNQMHVKREEFIQKEALFEQMVNKAYSELMSYNDIINSRIDELQSNKSLSNEDKAKMTQELENQKLAKQSEVLTILNNELDAMRRSLLENQGEQAPIETSPSATEVPTATQSETVPPEITGQPELTAVETQQATATQTETQPEQ